MSDFDDNDAYTKRVVAFMALERAARRELEQRVARIEALLAGVAPARLDADGTARPKTRIVHHPVAGNCFGPGVPLRDPEWESESGERIKLDGDNK